MYRIELVPGEVTVFRTVEELATGVRNGLITPKARIYHSASDKWLPIEFHPHYKQALELASGRHSAPSASKQSSTKPAERPRSEGLTFLNVPVSPTTPTSFPASGHSPAPASPAPQAPQPAPGADSPGRSRAMPEPVQLPWTMPAPDTSAHATGEFVPSAPPKRDPVEPASPYAPPIAPAAGDYATATRTAQVDPRALVMYHAAIEESASDESVVEETAFEDPAEVEVHPFEPVIRQHAPMLPPVSASPVLELPRISYPEITPAERPVASRPASARRPLHLAGAILVLAAGGYASSMLLSFGSGNDGLAAAATMADRPIVPIRPTAAPDARTTQGSPATAAASPAPPALKPAPRSASATGTAHPPTASISAVHTRAVLAPVDSSPLPPASSGFARALEPRAIVTTPLKPASAAGADSLPDAAPAIDMQVALPAVTGADSLAAPRQKNDSTMKKILRALNGGKAP